MKAIESTTIWLNGNTQTATHFNLKIISDNLSDSATFYYELINYDESKINDKYTKLNDGNLTIDGDDYQNWSGNNEQTYILCATNLNLKLI